VKEKKSCLALWMIALGFWLIALPLTFGYKGHFVEHSDIASGLLLAAFGLLSLKPSRIWSGWAAGLIGVWLQMAPVILWAPSALMYVNDTLVGAIAIVLSFRLAAKPNQSTDGDIPTGWSYNPSGWTHRIPTAFLAMLCWFFSRYMAAYQLGYIEQVWDPFFTDGTLHVITSKISKDFPFSDAGMGALCYTLEALLGLQGGTRRWADMPWLVLGFAFLVIPVGVVSLTLIILQPVVVGFWCSWCLFTALCMLLMIVLTAGELAAVLQLLWEVKRSGKSVWKVFWEGANRSAFFIPVKPLSRLKGASARGFSFPWNLLALIVAGVWLMASSSLLHVKGGLAMSNYIFGPLIVAFAVIALAEVFRGVRYLNLLFGLGLILTVWHGGDQSLAGTFNNLILGLLVIALTFPKGKITERYGFWDKWIL
jgi:uncharacterized membrane protein